MILQNISNGLYLFQVLDELGLQMTDQITGLPVAAGSVASTAKSKTPVAAAAGAGGGGAGADADTDDLEARLNNLRRE